MENVPSLYAGSEYDRSKDVPARRRLMSAHALHSFLLRIATSILCVLGAAWQIP